MSYGELRPNQFGTTVGLWHLNGNSTDFSGNNNHGSDTAITYSAANGKLGQGAGFNGSSSKILITANNAFNSAAHSIVAWVRPRVTQTSNGTIFQKYEGPNKGFDVRIVSDNSVYYCVYNGSTGIVCQTTKTLINAVWTHIVCTYDGTNLKAYINGNLEKTQAMSGSKANAAADQAIGVANAFSNQWFDGAIDEFSFHSTALTANQIRQIYAYQKGLLGRYA